MFGPEKYLARVNKARQNKYLLCLAAITKPSHPTQTCLRAVPIHALIKRIERWVVGVVGLQKGDRFVDQKAIHIDRARVCGIISVNGRAECEGGRRVGGGDAVRAGRDDDAVIIAGRQRARTRPRERT